MDMVTLLLAATIAIPPFGDVKVVDEIDCTKTDHRFADWPKGSSRVETILGKPCRVQRGCFGSRGDLPDIIVCTPQG